MLLPSWAVGGLFFLLYDVLDGCQRIGRLMHGYILCFAYVTLWSWALVFFFSHNHDCIFSFCFLICWYVRFIMWFLFDALCVYGFWCKCSSSMIAKYSLWTITILSPLFVYCLLKCSMLFTKILPSLSPPIILIPSRKLLYCCLFHMHWMFSPLFSACIR